LLGYRSQSIASRPNRDRAVLIGPEYGHPERSHKLQRAGRRVTVIVVGAGTRDRNASVRRRDERGILPRRAVVRDLEDVGLKINAAV
jgi:hypothetical protein